MHVKKRALITDLDNTLFDWVHIWFCCFRSMLDQMIMISGVPEAILIPEIKAVHQRHGTSEYSFLIEELPSLRRTYPGANLLNIFKPAIDAYRAQRRQHLKLYPSVAEALQQIKNRGSRIIGYTESMTFYSNYRVRHLGLDGVLDEVFSPADHDIPEGISLEQIRQYPAESYQLKSTVQQHTPKDSKKPNVDVLRSIIVRAGLTPSECVYIGDSLFKDIPMAQELGVSDVLAKYGAAQDRPEYDLLRKVTHWSDDDVQFEIEVKRRPIQKPSVVLEHTFDELLAHFEFDRHDG